MHFRFSDLFDIRSGVPIRQAYEKMAAGGTPVIVPKVVDIQKGIDYSQIKGLDMAFKPVHLLKGGEVLFCTKGTIKAAAYERQEKPCIASSAFLVLTPKENVYSAYIAAFLNSEMMRENYRSATNGATIPSLPISYVRDIEIALPPLEKQKFAVELLNLYNRKIALLNRRAELENGMKNILSKKIFTGDWA